MGSGNPIKKAVGGLIGGPVGLLLGDKIKTPSAIKELDPGKPMREAERQAKAQQAQQTAAISEQQAREKQKIAEETSEIKRRRAMALRRKGGRSMLVATSPTGVTKLGGTA